MNHERIITAFLICLPFILFIVTLKIRDAIKRVKRISALNAMADQYKTDIAEYDYWNGNAIGLSKTGNLLLTIQENDAGIKEKIISLPRFSSCSVFNDNTDAPYREGFFRVTKRIELGFFSDALRREVIVFYDTIRDGELMSNELQLAEKWHSVISDRFTLIKES